MKKILTIGAITLAVVGVIAAGTMSASAQTADSTNGYGAKLGGGQGKGQQASLESRAAIFGMTADELQTELESKTMSQIAVEKGMTEEGFRAKMTESAKARWESRGLSAEEVAKRVADKNTRHETNSADHEFGSGDGNHQGGYGRNR
ncbi:MAG: hypothetical protein PHC34_07805 [Candidatus Gastranaerophilales bacterium]|nr:hypothetical protein [Candidatus Gastranaerophilales bacterium]